MTRRELLKSLAACDVAAVLPTPTPAKAEVPWTSVTYIEVEWAYERHPDGTMVCAGSRVRPRGGTWSPWSMGDPPTETAALTIVDQRDGFDVAELRAFENKVNQGPWE